jgi:galactonate dehydratase
MVAEAVELVDQVRSAIGAEMDIMLDPASRWKLAEAKHVLKALEPYNLLFAEDFTTDPTPDILEKLSSSTFIPIAAGDRFSGFKDFEDLIYRNCVAVIQPDICHSGGISELKAIARMAENHGIRIAPHNPQGPLATAAAVHLDLTVPNFLIQEIAGTDFFGAWSHDSLFSMDDYAIAEGSIQSPQKPGFGVEVSDDLFDREWEVPPVPRFWDRSDFHVPEW